MKFKLIIDKTKDEEITATVHQRSELTDKIEEMVLAFSGSDRIAGYMEDDMKMLSFADIECINILDGKTCAIDAKGIHYRLRQRLYELEQVLPANFIRINKSAIANEKCLERFTVAYSGAVDAVFKCGYTEYVSRRCFAQIKRRYDTK